MRRRPSKAGTPLNAKQDELAQRELQLRDEMQKLERMIEDAPRLAEEKTRRQREELLARATAGRSRLDVSIALQDKRWGDDGNLGGPRRSLRKERSQCCPPMMRRRSLRACSHSSIACCPRPLHGIARGASSSKMGAFALEMLKTTTAGRCWYPRLTCSLGLGLEAS